MRRAQVLSIGWSVRGGDGVARRTPRDCERRVLSKIGPGSIVLLHDAWQGRCLPDEAGARPLTLEQQLQLAPAGVRALPRLLTELRARGYECVSLESMLNMI
jgi:peptidoglycan/xylan/chitin deacetylase (PgdA/CDA1 family)